MVGNPPFCWENYWVARSPKDTEIFDQDAGAVQLEARVEGSCVSPL